jgi:hypothetical protein
MRQYSVLWLDDEFDVLDLIYEDAAENGISLVGYKSAEEGVLALENTIFKYDAILVDGNFYSKKAHTGDNVSALAFGEVAKWLNQNQNSKKLPLFVLSGQTNFTSGTNELTALFDVKKVYEKQRIEDLHQLWLDIARAADEQPDTQVRHKYSKMLEACDSLDPAGESSFILLQILKNVHTSTPIDDELYYNQLRIVLEKLFRVANRYGLLHDKCISNGRVNLNASSLFMAGKAFEKLQIKCAVAHFPLLIANHVRNVLDVTNAASHTDDNNNDNRNTLTYYRGTVQTPYLLYSLTFALMDVIVWFELYVKDNNNVEQNRRYWIDTAVELLPGLDSEMLGTVIKTATNSFAFFKPNNGEGSSYIPSNIVKEHKLEGNEKVRASVKSVPKGTEVERLTVLLDEN